VLIKLLHVWVMNLLDRLERGPSAADFIKLTTVIEPVQTNNPLLDIWWQNCFAKVSHTPFSLTELPHHNNDRKIGTSIKVLYGLDVREHLDRIKCKISQKNPLSPWDILIVLAASENSLQSDSFGTFSYICEKLLLHFEVRKNIRLSVSGLENRLLAIAVLSCLFLNRFEQEKDWRFFNTALKINDILYRQLFKRWTRAKGQVKCLTAMMAWRAFSIQERTFSNLEKP